MFILSKTFFLSRSFCGGGLNRRSPSSQRGRKAFLHSSRPLNHARALSLALNPPIDSGTAEHRESAFSPSRAARVSKRWRDMTENRPLAYARGSDLGFSDRMDKLGGDTEITPSLLSCRIAHLQGRRRSCRCACCAHREEFSEIRLDSASPLRNPRGR
jgi:hypothetical protein